MEIQGFENYMIYEDGRVWSKNGKGRFLKPTSINKKGYLGVCLCNKDIKKTMKIHRLIALHYIPNPENKPEVDHIDNNRQNNNIENLRWATRSENNCNKGVYGEVNFKGVSKHRNKFRASSTRNGKKIHIGIYDTAEEAGEAFDLFKVKPLMV